MSSLLSKKQLTKHSDPKCPRSEKTEQLLLGAPRLMQAEVKTHSTRGGRWGDVLVFLRPAGSLSQLHNETRKQIEQMIRRLTGKPRKQKEPWQEQI